MSSRSSPRQRPNPYCHVERVAGSPVQRVGNGHPQPPALLHDAGDAAASVTHTQVHIAASTAASPAYLTNTWVARERVTPSKYPYTPSPSMPELGHGRIPSYQKFL